MVKSVISSSTLPIPSTSGYSLTATNGAGAQQLVTPTATLQVVGYNVGSGAGICSLQGGPGVTVSQQGTVVLIQQQTNTSWTATAAEPTNSTISNPPLTQVTTSANTPPTFSTTSTYTAITLTVANTGSFFEMRLSIAFNMTLTTNFSAQILVAIYTSNVNGTPAFASFNYFPVVTGKYVAEFVEFSQIVTLASTTQTFYVVPYLFQPNLGWVFGGNYSLQNMRLNLIETNSSLFATPNTNEMCVKTQVATMSFDTPKAGTQGSAIQFSATADPTTFPSNIIFNTAVDSKGVSYVVRGSAYFPLYFNGYSATDETIIVITESWIGNLLMRVTRNSYTVNSTAANYLFSTTYSPIFTGGALSYPAALKASISYTTSTLATVTTPLISEIACKDYCPAKMIFRTYVTSGQPAMIPYLPVQGIATSFKLGARVVLNPNNSIVVITATTGGSTNIAYSATQQFATTQIMINVASCNVFVSCSVNAEFQFSSTTPTTSAPNIHYILYANSVSAPAASPFIIGLVHKSIWVGNSQGNSNDTLLIEGSFQADAGQYNIYACAYVVATSVGTITGTTFNILGTVDAPTNPTNMIVRYEAT